LLDRHGVGNLGRLTVESDFHMLPQGTLDQLRTTVPQHPCGRGARGIVRPLPPLPFRQARPLDHCQTADPPVAPRGVEVPLLLGWRASDPKAGVTPRLPRRKSGTTGCPPRGGM
jgi:hypothetical protein